MRIADLIIEILVDNGITDFFGLVGGGSMHLNDAIRIAHESGRINVTFFHSELAAAYAAGAVAKYLKKPTVCFVTSGCGSTHTVSGVLSAFQDHTPVIFLAGAVNTYDQIQRFAVHSSTAARQIGVQEANLLPIVSSIVNGFSVLEHNIDRTVQIVKQSILTAMTAPRGPVWIEVPLDVQSVIVETLPDHLEPVEIPHPAIQHLPEYVQQQFEMVHRRVKEAKNPALILGGGVKMYGGDEAALFIALEDIGIPFVSTFMGTLPAIGATQFNRLAQLNRGVIGIKGQQAANEFIRTADLIIAVGTRLSTATIGYHGENVAVSQLIVIDVCQAVHTGRSYNPAMLIGQDAVSFLIWMSNKVRGEQNV